MQIIKRLKTLLFLLIVFLVVSVIFFSLTVAYSKPTASENSPDIEKAKQEDFKNCVIIRSDNIALVLAKVETDFKYATDAHKLPDKLKGVNKLKIIYAKDAVYDNVVKVPNAVAASGMQNYKLLKM